MLSVALRAIRALLPRADRDLTSRLASTCLPALGVCTLLIALIAGPVVERASAAGPDAMRDLAGCGANVLPRNDDGSTGRVLLPFPTRFYGTTYNGLYVNNNGNVTFDAPLGEYTPFPLASYGSAMIAPFFG